ncbi:LPXTG cell wall anchor domain-containing protein [Streptomyces sp. Wb2n-11]|uniref:LPXTG cell wall anchor domain-containing protein n=1 Tax=Streptomyces sp. Wb2n-11 TaxID=1030533 RepID=UPI000ACD323A|nr:LPXTG cell wall anchor domain-containing protein [Streptomyces sp. Wb2n-11]
MRFRRILATAAVAAVTTPVALLSVTPAFADTKPATQEQPGRLTLAQLEKAAAEAQKAYDDAVLAEKEGREVLEAALADTTPLAVAATAAVKAAEEAGTAKAAADKALADAEAALTDAATPEEREAAEKAVTDAEAAAKAAGEAKTAADAEAGTALDARDDERVAAVRAYDLLKKAVEKALEDKRAADEALAEAREEEGNEDDTCVPEPELTTVVTGLPSEVVAGEWVNFRLRLTNGTEKTMDEVYPYASVHATDRSGLKDIDDLLKLQWSSASSTTWKTVDDTYYIDPVSPLEAGAHSDIKLRLKVDAKAPAGQGVAFAAGDYYNDDESCGGTPDLATYEFEIAAAAAAGTPGNTPDATPTPSATPAATPTATPTAVAPTPQGGVSDQPVNGSLANTGSSSAVPQVALVGGAALLAGAGAVFAARRRRGGSAA